MKTIAHKFVELIPENLESAVIYISTKYCTAIHKCCCGCGNEVVTPFSPTDWKLIFDGESITLSPSIGNWSFDCRSHYFIRNSEVHWAGTWSAKEIEKGRLVDKKYKAAYYNNKNQSSVKVSERKTKHKKWKLSSWLNVMLSRIHMD
jgi:hypothetical protein